MPRYIAEKTILLQLLEDKRESTPDALLTRELVLSSKRTSYEYSTRRLTFTLADQAAEIGWHSKRIMYRGASLRLLCPTILECEDSPLNKPVHLRFGTDELRYQAMVLATGVSAGAIETILYASVDCAVVSVSRASNASTTSYDSNFYLATFDSRECPEPLTLFTHITASGVSLFLHHFRDILRAP